MRNLLNEWRDVVYTRSSPVMINQPFYRSDIDFVYDTFKSFFTLQYFDVAPNQFQYNWLNYLLVSPLSISSVINLFEITKVILEVKHQPKYFQNTINSYLQSPGQLREAFFEIYIQLVLKNNNIKFHLGLKDETNLNKQLDIVIEHNGIDYLVECNRLKLPHNERAQVLSDVLVQLENVIVSNNPNGQYTITPFASICCINIKNFESLNLFESVKSLYLEYVDSTFQRSFIRTTYPNALGNKDADLYLYPILESLPFKNPDGPHAHIRVIVKNSGIIKDGLELYHVKVLSHFFLAEEIFKDRSQRNLNKKIVQHAASKKYLKKIIFYDCEAIWEIQQPMFRKGISFNKEEISKYLKDVLDEEILFIVLRDYTKQEPEFDNIIFKAKEHPEIIPILEYLKFDIAVHKEFSIVERCIKYKLKR